MASPIMYIYMHNLVNSSDDVISCYLSTIDGLPILKLGPRIPEGLSTRLRNELQFLKQICPELEWSFILTVDGYAMASDLLSQDGEKLDTWYASLMSLGVNLVRHVGFESAQYIKLDGKSGSILWVPIDSEFFFMALLQPNTVLESALPAIQQSMSKIYRHLNS